MSWINPSSPITWDQLQSAAAALTLNNKDFPTTFQHTSAQPWKWQNTFPATSGLAQSSPILTLIGNYWTGAVSALDTYTIQNIIQNGTNPTTALTIQHTGSSGTASLRLQSGASYINIQFNTGQMVVSNSSGGFNISAGGGLTLVGNGGAQISLAVVATIPCPLVLSSPANGASVTLQTITELITLNTGGTTTDSAANLLPANSIIDTVVARVTTTITTATNWELGDATTPARFSSPNGTLTAGTTQVGLNHMKGSVAIDAAGPVQIAAAKLRITTTGTPGAGVIRVTVFYRLMTPPTS